MILVTVTKIFPGAWEIIADLIRERASNEGKPSERSLAWAAVSSV